MASREALRRWDQGLVEIFSTMHLAITIGARSLHYVRSITIPVLTWQKLSAPRLAKSLLNKVKNAVEERSKQVTEFKELTEDQDQERIAEWTQQVEAWEGGAELNPFEVTRHRELHRL